MFEYELTEKDLEKVQAIIKLGNDRIEIEKDFIDGLISYNEYLDSLEDLKDDSENVY